MPVFNSEKETKKGTTAGVYSFTTSLSGVFTRFLYLQSLWCHFNTEKYDMPYKQKLTCI